MPNPLKQKPLRVVLAQPDNHLLPAMAEALSADPDIELTEVKDSPENIWRAVITQSPDVTVFYAPTLEKAELSCINHILHGVYSRILLLVEEELSTPPQDSKLELYRLAKLQAGNKAGIERVISRVKAMGPVKKHEEGPHEPDAQAVSMGGYTVSEALLQKQLIAIGASTGGTEALAKLFRLLPENMPGIVVVQHMPPVFTKMYAERLNKELPFAVTEAGDNVVIKPRTIHIAPGDRHLVIKKRGSCYYTTLGDTEKVSGHCPSVDVLFDSVSIAAGKKATGVILTGMGADGALGLLHMRNAGAFTIGQDEASSVVYGMPRKASDYGAVMKQAALTDIPRILLSHLSKQG